MMASSIRDWLVGVCEVYALEPIAIYRAASDMNAWPLTAGNEQELQAKLKAGGHLVALPKEPAALANIIEVSIVDYLIRELQKIGEQVHQRGTERGYPDLEISGPAFGGGHHAIDVKIARRAKSGKQTESRITLYTGNTYFRYPDLHLSGTYRAFNDYVSHLDIIGLYTLDETSFGRIKDLELLVQEPWKIGSKQRSSTTREYIGAVTSIADLKAGKGEFATAEEFYKFWRAYPFKIGRLVQKQLDKMIEAQTKAATQKPKS